MTNHNLQRIALIVGILLLLTSVTPVPNHYVKAQTIGTSEGIQQLLKAPNKVSTDSLLLVLYELESINQSYIRQSGWLYSLVERNSPFAENNPGTIYEGLTPKVSTHESWVLLLNDDGLLGEASFDRISDEQGQLVQISAGSKETVGGNLTLLKRGAEPDLQALPDNLNRQHATAQSQVSQIIKQIQNFKDEIESVKVQYYNNTLSVEIRFNMHATHFEQYSEPVLAFNQTTSFDILTGNVLEGKTMAVLASGEQQLWLQYQNIAVRSGQVMPKGVERDWKNTLYEISEVLKTEKSPNNFLFGTSSYPNYVGTSTAVATSTNSRGADNVYCLGKSSIESPAVSINVIGGSNIWCTEKCRYANGSETVISSGQTGAWPAYSSSSYSKGKHIAWYSCPVGSSAINTSEVYHEFNHTGSINWHPITIARSYN